MPCDLIAARRKLRQAEILRDYLSSLPKEIASDMRRARNSDYSPVLEAFFSASFDAVRACFFIMRTTGGREFTVVERKWRNSYFDQEGRKRWNAMLKIRDNDVVVLLSKREFWPFMMRLFALSSHCSGHRIASIGTQCWRR
jgi:hypothetical protein